VDFGRATFTAVMGPSGSGKSTLLHCAAGLERPTSGEVLVDGLRLDGLSETRLTLLRRERIGFVFQSFNLLPFLDAKHNVALPLLLAGRRPARADMTAALAAVGLADRAGHRPAELSGGQQQRVALARALMAKPAVLFADEPTGTSTLRPAVMCSHCSATRWTSTARRWSWSPTIPSPRPTPTGWCSCATAVSSAISPIRHLR
jgi:putative ABC transport system ATP-binding protein